MYREGFSLFYFIFLINEEKKFRKDIKQNSYLKINVSYILYVKSLS